MTAPPAGSFVGDTAYNKGIYRNAGAPAGGEPLVPTPVSAQIIQELPTASTALSLMRRVTMSSTTQRQPVLATLPQAFFLSSVQGTTPDYDLKKTTQQRWTNVSLVAEELAVIVPVPLAYLQDAQVDIWSEVRPRIVEALGVAIDAAVLFGVNKPTTWSTDIYTQASAAGNFIAPGTVAGGTDLDYGVAITKAGRNLKKQGFSINGFISAPGFGWQLAAYRSVQGLPIYVPNVNGTPGGNLYGFPTREAMNGAFDDKKASLLAGQWDNAIIGVRQDISFDVFDQGVIQDAAGAITLNLMQQDSVALRCVMRLGFATANPVTAVASNRGRTQNPFYVVTGTADLS